MKMYKIDDIIEILETGRKSKNKYAGFEANREGNLIITLKEHAPDWRNPEGFGEAVTELELLECSGEY
ncbi:alcohol dehydrogenase [Blautia marasmi]|uniref:alcohol dehydrogenase n=1 Tax=Blautia marasmi TaxID=1917868 RepID=UPI000CF29AEC|nr:alcohol dehydrogenase [Blautia marasmi]